MQEERINNETQESLNESVSIGALLVSARNTAALGQVDVAEQINLPLRIIRALEQDDYDCLPEATYIRGYLRNYARVVGIDADSLIKTYNEQHHQEPEVVTSIRSKQSYDTAILWSTAAVFTILIGLVITWWFDSNQQSQITDELEGANKNNVAQVNSVDRKMNQNLDVESETGVDEIIVESTPDIVVPEQSTTSTSEEAITLDEQQAMENVSQNPNLVTLDDNAMLTVTYVEKSWTEIRDADSNTLMQGLIEPGVVRNLSGKPPFEVFLGNSPGVVIEVNGLYFDHSQYRRSNRTARFQVSSNSLN